MHCLSPTSGAPRKLIFCMPPNFEYSGNKLIKNAIQFCLFKVVGHKGRRKKWRTKKVGSKPNGEKENNRRKMKKGEQYKDIINKLESIGDPYDEMDMKTKKEHAVHHFYDNMKVFVYER